MKITNDITRTNAFVFTKKLCRRLPMALALGAAVMLAATRPAAAAPYTWNVTTGNWSTTNNWNPNTTPGLGGPLPTDSVIFGNTAGTTTTSPATVNNTVDLGFDGTVTNLTYNSSAIPPAAFVYDVTQIPAGETLTVSGNLLVGGVNGPNNALTTEAYMVGGGTLLVTATNLMVQNYDNTTRAGATAYFNLSGLTNFIYSNTNGTIRYRRSSSLGTTPRFHRYLTVAEACPWPL